MPKSTVKGILIVVSDLDLYDQILTRIVNLHPFWSSFKLTNLGNLEKPSFLKPSYLLLSNVSTADLKTILLKEETVIAYEVAGIDSNLDKFNIDLEKLSYKKISGEYETLDSLYEQNAFSRMYHSS